jgi:hypothetical protein
MGRADLIGSGPHQLVPHDQPDTGRDYRAPRRKNSGAAHQRRVRGRLLTQHTGLPPLPEDDLQAGRASTAKRRRKPTAGQRH